MIKFIKRLFCKHKNIEFKRNLYGDSINIFNARSMWTCKKCNKLLLESDLYIKEEDSMKTFYDPFTRTKW